MPPPRSDCLALVAGQDVEQDDDGTWKIARKVAPDRIISTVDPEARHMHKSRSEYRDGYKAHIAIEPETGLVTAAALTPANAPDGPTGVVLLAGEEPGLQVLGDGAYGIGRDARRTGQGQAPSGHQALADKPQCPAASNVTTSSSTSSRNRHLPGRTHRHDHARPSCRLRDPLSGCPLRKRCTNAKDGRTLHLHPHDAELD